MYFHPFLELPPPARFEPAAHTPCHFQTFLELIQSHFSYSSQTVSMKFGKLASYADFKRVCFAPGSRTCGEQILEFVCSIFQMIKPSPFYTLF